MLISSAWSLAFVYYDSKGWSSGYAFRAEAQIQQNGLPFVPLSKREHTINVGFVCGTTRLNHALKFSDHDYLSLINKSLCQFSF